MKTSRYLHFRGAQMVDKVVGVGRPHLPRMKAM